MRRSVISGIAISVAAFIGLAGIPVGTNDLVSHPSPAPSYDAAINRITLRQRHDDTVAAPGGESILLTQGHRVPLTVVLFHGLTNSPRQFDSLARMLYRDGANVYVPRLPLHAQRGGNARMLARLSAKMLCAAADSAIDVAAALGDTVVVAGLSLGGTVAAWVAQHRSDVHRVVVIAPLIAPARVPRLLQTPLRNLAIRLPDVAWRQSGSPDAPDREPGWSTRAVAQTALLGVAVRRGAADSVPAAHEIGIVLNMADHTVAPDPVLALADRWRAQGAAVTVVELPARLGLPHDVIDPRQRIRRPDVVYPLIISLIRGQPVSTIACSSGCGGGRQEFR
jgi:pimeloyl-ACP methyl ester carboxylesterase